MTHQVRTFARRAIWVLPVWAALLFFGTLTHQPDPQTAFGDFAAYVTTDRFLASHLLNSILGAAIGSIGVIGLMLLLQDTKAAGKALTGMVATVVANSHLLNLWRCSLRPACHGSSVSSGAGECTRVLQQRVCSPSFSYGACVTVAVHRGRRVHRHGYHCEWTLAALDRMGVCNHNGRLRSQQLPSSCRADRHVSLAFRRNRRARVDCQSRAPRAQRLDRSCCSRLGRFALPALCPECCIIF